MADAFGWLALAAMLASWHLVSLDTPGLRQFIARAFGEVFGNHTKVKQGRAYTVAMARKV